ncbi:MAG: rod shape-determining protein MreD [Rhodobacteraceae bacterium CG17_big_fil_post_rev_8_21_14_2_50_63_15]|nr:rod shape-determining protein MreD [Roseovarius sp.]PIV77244.1 MAG: rod shape-determining protein MreD [Rhodobacteraceae bacterium CG17_big_fil_post_rev_8_21_14_2_50_63_15]
MADRLIPRHWIMRMLYVVLCLILIFVLLLPLGILPPSWAGPDLMLALTFAWVVRRPDYVPAALIAIIALSMDLLLQRPPGLWAALVVGGAEALRNRVLVLRDLGFSAEWATVASTMILVTLGYRFVLALLMVDQAPLGLSLMQLISTLTIYPVVAFVSQTVLGVRKLAPGDVDTMRRRT